MNSNESSSTTMLPGFPVLNNSDKGNEVEPTQQQKAETVAKIEKTIKRIDFIKYRKLENISFDFTSEVNIISGVNGTCKSSLLHLISNAFQRPTAKDHELSKCLRTLRAINAGVNQKIEALARESKRYQDPAKEVKGPLFEITYANDLKLKFRRHNSKQKNRFCLKPPYSHGKKENLPAIPVVYLGLSRLYPIGEFQKNDEIENIDEKLPTSYREEIKNMYNDLVNIKIEILQPQRMKGIKVRNDFSSTLNEIDGNTISSGEDNVFIILTALYSLKYYFETLPESEKQQGSILLIDEFDATLHPSLQERLLDLIRDFSKKYRIQFFATTHSLSLLENCLKKKDNILYLSNDISRISLMEKPDIYKIKAKLKTLSRKDIFEDKKIPVFTEDNEARIFLSYYLKYLASQDNNFALIQDRFHFVDANIGADALRGVFSDVNLKKNIGAICILDGDKTQEHPECVIALPGKASPEHLLFEYAEKQFNNNSEFWHAAELEQNYIDIQYYQQVIQKDYNKAVTGPQKTRDALKALWKKHEVFVLILLKYWLRDPENEDALKTFTYDFHICFLKTAEYHGINKNDWPLQVGRTND